MGKGLHSVANFARLKLLRPTRNVNGSNFFQCDETRGVMPARHFDRARVRAVRRAAELSQGDVAAEVGVAVSSIAGWEADGPTSPDPEKLPALARALGKNLDALFPRAGLPDLADLRCDAGLYRYETAQITGTKSAGPVTGAEQGVRRLKERYVPALARAYGVSTEVLLASQERSFGNEAREPGTGGSGGSAMPVSLGEKIDYLLGNTRRDAEPPTDQQIADGVNASAEAAVVDAEGISALRTGGRTGAPDVVLAGLADYFGVSRLFFASDEEAVRQVVEGLKALAAFKQGSISALAARGLGDEGLPADLIAEITRIAEEFQNTNPAAEPRKPPEPGRPPGHSAG